MSTGRRPSGPVPRAQTVTVAVHTAAGHTKQPGCGDGEVNVRAEGHGAGANRPVGVGRRWAPTADPVDPAAGRCSQRRTSSGVYTGLEGSRSRKRVVTQVGKTRRLRGKKQTDAATGRKSPGPEPGRHP